MEALGVIGASLGDSGIVCGGVGAGVEMVFWVKTTSALSISGAIGGFAGAFDKGAAGVVAAGMVGVGAGVAAKAFLAAKAFIDSRIEVNNWTFMSVARFSPVSVGKCRVCAKRAPMPSSGAKPSMVSMTSSSSSPT